ncbi:hypothetical protein CEXT_311011 [Caerostris extrusa]|uniref:Uncharacterized protein n=1 Tax=Caerostris extrusa TaxID=172846 RepID=A0AAV4REC2_CAEEX|nr:hypothetical protein CEXT_311011 [Caerostris extrusa]
MPILIKRLFRNSQLCVTVKFVLSTPSAFLKATVEKRPNSLTVDANHFAQSSPGPPVFQNNDWGEGLQLFVLLHVRPATRSSAIKQSFQAYFC